MKLITQNDPSSVIKVTREECEEIDPPGCI